MWPLPREPDRGSALDDIVVDLCGGCAQSRLTSDLDSAFSDRYSAEQFAKAVTSSRQEMNELLAEAHRLAEELVARYWSVIVDLARELDAAGRLNDVQIREIVGRGALGRALLNQPDPIRPSASVPTKKAPPEIRYPDEIRHRMMTAQLEPQRPEDIARRRRAQLEALCRADGYDPTMWFDEWIRMMIHPVPPYRGGKIFGKA
jgi:hypothetical protein